MKTQKQVLKDGWMICDFTSFPTVFQLHQDNENERLCSMEPCLGGTEKSSSPPQAGLVLGTTRSVGQCLTY